MTIENLTDEQLAGMVRRSVYIQGRTFGDGEGDSRFLLVLAIPYGPDEGVDHLTDAIQAFAALLQDADWRERHFQVYDHKDQRFFDTTMEEIEGYRDNQT